MKQWVDGFDALGSESDECISKDSCDTEVILEEILKVCGIHVRL